MQRRQLLTTVGSIAGAGLLTGMAGCTGSADDPDSASGGADTPADTGDTDKSTPGAQTETSESTPTQAPATEAPAVTILDHELVVDDYSTSVKGMVKNTSGEEQSYIEVQSFFFDESDTRIGEGLWNATDVPSDQELSFDAMFLGDGEVDHYELEATISAL